MWLIAINRLTALIYIYIYVYIYISLCLFFLEKDCVYLDAEPLYDHIKTGDVSDGLGTYFIGSVSGRVYLFKKIIYARRVRVRSDSGRFGSGTDFRTREDLYCMFQNRNPLWVFLYHCISDGTRLFSENFGCHFHFILNVMSDKVAFVRGALFCVQCYWGNLDLFHSNSASCWQIINLHIDGFIGRTQVGITADRRSRRSPKWGVNSEIGQNLQNGAGSLSPLALASANCYWFTFQNNTL